MRRLLRLATTICEPAHQKWRCSPQKIIHRPSKTVPSCRLSSARQPPRGKMFSRCSIAPWTAAWTSSMHVSPSCDVFDLSLYGERVRVFALDPIPRATRTVRRVAPFEGLVKSAGTAAGAGCLCSSRQHRASSCQHRAASENVALAAGSTDIVARCSQCAAASRHS